jgi:hypothetical protein
MAYGLKVESFEFVNGDDEVEASVAKQRLSEPLTPKDRNNIRRLYDDRYSLARIR